MIASFFPHSSFVLPKVYPSPTQGVPKVYPSPSSYFEYGYTMGRVCLHYGKGHRKVGVR